MKSIFTGLVSLLLVFNASAQRTCASESYQLTHPGKELVETGLYSRDTLSNELIRIPVVVHVLYNNSAQNISDAQVISQINALNVDFSKTNPGLAGVPAVFAQRAADTRIQFCLAKSDQYGRATTGIIRKYTSTTAFMADDAMKYSQSGGDNAWNSQQYLNIWVCPMLGRNLGYSSAPGSTGVADGVVISYDVFGTVGAVRSPFNLGRTATHEIGHWLGLRHIWGDSDCGDDGVDDTPRQRGYNYNCPTFPHMSTCSPDANGDMFMNYMDFVNDACMHMFTKGQKNRMRAQFSEGGYRNAFLHATGCDSALLEAAPLPVEETKADNVAIQLYPNPAQDYFIIQGEFGQLAGRTLEIFSMTGTRVLTAVIYGKKKQINIATLPAGSYIIKLSDSKSSNSYRLQKL